MKVKAISQGFYGGSRRREGDVFEFGGDKPYSWMEPVADEKPARKPREKAESSPTPADPQ